MMRVLLATLFFAVVFTAPAIASPIVSPLKILQLNFNSEENPNDTHEVVRDLRFHAITKWIKDSDADIILLQEAWTYRSDSTMAITLARTLEYDVAYRLEMGFPRFFYEADAILTKKSLHMSGQKDLKLPHSA